MADSSLSSHETPLMSDMKNGNGKSITSCGHLLKKTMSLCYILYQIVKNICAKRLSYVILFLKLQHNLNELWIYFISYIKLQHKLDKTVNLCYTVHQIATKPELNGEFMIHFTWNWNETWKKWIYVICVIKLQQNIKNMSYVFFHKIATKHEQRWIYAIFYKYIATQANCELRTCIPAVHTENS